MAPRSSHRKAPAVLARRRAWYQGRWGLQSANVGTQPAVESWLTWPGPDLDLVAPSPFDHAQTGIVATGAQFGASQGAGTVELGNSADYATASKQAQTVTAWADGSITFTANLGTLGPGQRWVFVTTNGGLTSEGRPVAVRRAAAFTDSASTNIAAAGADATTARLTAPSGKTTSDFDAGRRVDDGATTPSTTTTASDYTEHELAIEATAAAVATETYEFRLVRSDGSLLNAYTVTPEWTIGGGGGPAAGSSTAAIGVVARITGTKVGGGTARPAVPVVTRTTGTKIAVGVARTSVSAVARVTGSKIASGATRTVGAPVVRVTGTASTVVQGAARALVAVAGRITGTKTATGGAVVAVPVVTRSTGSKIATGSTRAAQAVVVLVSGTASGVVAGSARALVAVVARVTGSKVATAGAARVVVPTAAQSSGSKIGTGAARAVVPVAARVTGSKISGAALVVVSTVARVTGHKIAGGAATAIAPVVARITGSKVAGGSGRVAAAVTVAPVGTKIGRGTVRAAWAVIVRTPSATTTELWSWYLRRSGGWQPASPKLDGVHPTTTDVT